MSIEKQIIVYQETIQCLLQISCFSELITIYDNKEFPIEVIKLVLSYIKMNWCQVCKKFRYYSDCLDCNTENWIVKNFTSVVPLVRAETNYNVAAYTPTCWIGNCEEDCSIIVEWNKYFVKHNKRFCCHHKDITHLSTTGYKTKILLCHKKVTGEEVMILEDK